MIKLYEVPQEWKAILDALEQGFGEITPEIEQAMGALISDSKDKLASAACAYRNLELQATFAASQAQVFQDEADRCMRVVASFKGAAERLGALMVPALEITGKVKTPVGTLFTTTRTSWSFELATGTSFFDLDEKLWRQKDPELNKTELKKLAEAGTLPAEILAASTSHTSASLRTPAAPKADETAA